MDLRYCAALALYFLLTHLQSCTTVQTLKPFTSDGCSVFPDRSLINDDNWCDCCFEHDMAYWKGGTKEEREQADKRFKNCILETTGDSTFAEIMYTGVRLGGSPYFPTWYRWGYGWNHPRGYRPLSPDEKRLVDELLTMYLKNHDISCDSIQIKAEE